MCPDRIYHFDLTVTPVPVMLQVLRSELPGINLTSRHHFRLLAEYVDWMRVGRKHTTIRLKPEAIDYPAQRYLSLIAVDKYESNGGMDVGELTIDSITIKPFRMLTHEDAIRDGFANLSELVCELTTIYGPIADTDLVSIYETNLIPAGVGTLM